MGIWIPDAMMTDPLRFVGLGTQQVFLGMYSPRLNYPFYRAILTRQNLTRGQRIANGAFWYTSVMPFTLSAGRTYDFMYAATNVSPGVVGSATVDGVDVDPRIAYLGSVSTVGQDGIDPLFYWNGPYLNDGAGPYGNANFLVDTPHEVAVTPEPSALLLLATGLAA